MKKSKLILTISSLAVVASPITAITSCNKGNSNNNEIKVFSMENKLVGSEDSGQLYFNLSKPLSDGQTLTVKDLTDNIEWSFESQAKTWNNIGVVNFAKTKVCVEGQTSKINLRFTCSDSKSNSDLWSVDVNEIKFVYSSSIALAAGQSKEDGWAEGTPEIAYGSLTYTFDLTEALPENYELIVNLNQDTSKSSPNVYAASGSLKPTISSDRKHATVTVTITKQSGASPEKPNYGEYAGFDLKFICNDEKKATFWSQTIAGFKLSYKAAEVPVPINETNYEVVGNVLKSVTIPDGNTYNVIEIPRAITTANGIVSVTSVADDFWANSVAKSTQQKMDKITVLRMLWSTESSARGCCPKYGHSAFKDSKITTIDVSAIPNSLKGLKTLLDIAPDDGTGNGAFTNVPANGNIKWNSEFTSYKKHIIKEKLYMAGVPNTWFGIVNVGTEEELVEQLDQGNSIKLTADITLNNPLNVYTSSIMDLNGHTIKAAKTLPANPMSGKYAMLTVWTDVSLLINDTSGTANGGIIAAAETAGQTTDLHFPIDVRCQSNNPLETPTILEIYNGRFVGNKNVINNYRSTVYIEGGQYETNEIFTQAQINYAQTFYDNLLFVNDNNDTDPDWYGNFFVYAGKFKGHYYEGSYDNFVQKVAQQNIGGFHKTCWVKNQAEATALPSGLKPIVIPTPNAEIEMKAYGSEFVSRESFPTPVENPISKDECFADPFHTYSQTRRIAHGAPVSDKNWWTTWYPNDDTCTINVKYVPHDANGDNWVEVSWAAK